MAKKNIYVALPDGYVRQTFISPMVREVMDNTQGMRFTFNETGKILGSDELKEHLQGQDGCILGWGCTKMTNDILDALPNLKVLGVLGGAVGSMVGEEFFDYPDRLIINSAEVMAKSVAEATLGYMMCGLRDIAWYDRKMREGMLWKDRQYYNKGLFYKTISLIGLGQVGRFLVDYLKPFEVKVLIYDPYISEEDDIFSNENVRKVELDCALEEAEVVSLHAGYTKETHHMLNREKLSLLKPGTLLVNTARGGIIDQKALIDVLKQNKIKAVLDVYEREPLPLESELRELDNVTLIPHMAGPTIDMRQYMGLSIVEDFAKIFRGEEVKSKISKQQYLIMT